MYRMSNVVPRKRNGCGAAVCLGSIDDPHGSTPSSRTRTRSHPDVH